MGHQIIRQPDGRYAVFSSIVDSWILCDATERELEDYYAKDAGPAREEDTRRSFRRIMKRVKGAVHPYGQFTMTFDQANAVSVKHGGEDLSGKLPDAEFRQQAAEFMDRNDGLLRRLARSEENDE